MKKSIALILLAFLFVACDKNVYYDQQQSINENGWSLQDSVVFTVDVDDTLSLFDFLIEVRNSTDYPYSNAFLFINTTFPDKSVARDTLECILADPTGQWLGKHTGRYVDTRYRLRGAAARFPMKGEYTFAVSHGMRDTIISGIHDIGFRVEYNQSK